MSEIIEVFTKKKKGINCPLIHAWVDNVRYEVCARVVLPNGEAAVARKSLMGSTADYGDLFLVDDYEPPEPDKWHLKLQFPH